MITGKSKCRHLLAKQSVENFIQQTYDNKKLIIINHGDNTINTQKYSNVHEFKIDKKNMTLGDLRNISLNLVPPNAYWTIWDDDDYRCQDYLSFLYSNLKKYNADLLSFTTRYEYNYKTNLVWQVVWKPGFVTCLCRKDGRFEYLSKESMEDVHLLPTYRKLGHKVVVLDNNDPNIYLRLVHGDNTSKWVNQDKKRVSAKSSHFYEKDVDTLTKQKVSNFISLYYKEGLQCIKSL